MSDNLNKRVLIIDDNDAIHEDFRLILCPSQDHSALHALEASIFGGEAPIESTAMSFELSSMFQGEDGVAAVKQSLEQQTPFAMAFVDVRMPPGIDGVVAASRILALDPDIQIVICSAHSDYSWTDMMQVLGQTDRVLILRKPFDPIEARQLAYALCQKWSTARELRRYVGSIEALAEKRARELVAAQNQVSELNEAVEDQEKRLHFLTTHDALTGLPDRTVFLGRVELALEGHQRRSQKLAVMVIDVYRFKQLTDAYGTDAGNELLIEVAHRIRQQVRRFDVIARVGSDEYVVLIEEIEDTDAILATARRIHRSMEEPIFACGHEIYASLSIGVTYNFEPDTKPEQLLRDATFAMGRALANGKGRTEILQTEDSVGSLRQLRTENEIAHALRKEEFVVYYQPIISLSSGGVVGFEALVRWDHPQRGFLMPDSFISIAEESRDISALGEWVLMHACGEIAQVNKVHKKNYFISVNVSGRQIDEVRFLDCVASALSETGLSPSALRLELTETTLLESILSLDGRLQAIRDLGVSLCLDDFGTGYSSLAVFSRMPISVLKIDQVFVRDMTRSSTALTMINAMLGIASAMGVDVVAEGIETEEQLSILKSLGCGYGQGFLISRPFSGSGLSKYVTQRPPARVVG